MKRLNIFTKFFLTFLIATSLLALSSCSALLENLQQGGLGGGNTDGGNTDDGNTDGGNTDDGNTDGGNTDDGNTDDGNTDGGNTDGGNTDGGNTDGGNTDGGNTDGGNTDGEAHEHSLGEWYGNTATCTEGGTEVRDCSGCDYSESRDTEALGHDWNDATCTLPKTCANCPVTEGEALGHTEATAATCTTLATCSVCNESYGEVDSTAHDWNAATCTLPKTCADCHSTEGEALGHTEATAATCTTLATCSVCSESYGEVDNTAHDWNDATCTLPKTCADCQSTEGEALGHRESTAATCSKLATCSVCGLPYGNRNPNKHSWKGATCTEPITCEWCGRTTGSAYGHSWVAATCTAAKTCRSCGETDGEALGHDIKNMSALSASCISIGFDDYEYCTRCTYSTRETTPELGHSYDANGECTRCSTRYSTGLEFTAKRDGTCAVSGIGTCTDKFIVIPPTSPDGATVTEIGARAFYEARITSVEIPNTVTTIGYHAFSESSIVSVVLPSSVTSIDMESFRHCSHLVEAVNNSDLRFSTYHNSGYTLEFFDEHPGESKIDNVDGLLFYTLEDKHYVVGYVGEEGDLVLPDFYNGETYQIARRAFSGYSSSSSIADVTVGKGVTYIGSSAFSDSDITALRFAEDPMLERFGAEAFGYCESLVSIEIPKLLTYAPDLSIVFCCCPLLTEIKYNAIDLPAEYATSLFDDLGNGADGITITIGKDVKRIPPYLISGYFSSVNATVLEFENGSVCEEICESAFEGCNFESLEIPASVNKIGDYAFGYADSATVYYNCANLNEKGYYLFYGGSETSIRVVIGNTVTHIPDYLFDYSDVTSVEFEQGSVCESIGKSAFDNSKITSIVIPASVRTIGDSAFGGCSLLESATYEDGSNLETIGVSAFSGCTALKCIVIPEKVTKIGTNAFFYCSSATEIKYNAIECEKFTSETLAFKSVGCETDETVFTVGKNVKKIPDYILYDYYQYEHNIRALVFEDESTCESIGYKAFYGSAALASVEIPESLTKLYYCAFAFCGITEIKYNAVNCTLDSYTSDHPLYRYDWFETRGDVARTVTIGNKVETLPPYLFSKSRVSTVIFEEGSVLSKIGSSFVGCKITSIEIPASVKIIGSSFNNCSELSSVIFAEGSAIERLEGGFSGCTSLTEIDLPDTITFIGHSTFAGCTALSAIDLPDSLTVIYGDAFNGCTGLTEIVIPEGVTQIIGGAFAGCTGITSVVLPASLEYIDPTSFDYANLESIVFTDPTGWYCTDVLYAEFTPIDEEVLSSTENIQAFFAATDNNSKYLRKDPTLGDQ